MTSTKVQLPRWRRWLQRVLLVVPVVVGLEIVLRLLGVAVSVPAPPPTAEEARDPNLFRVVCIGDSWTIGAPDGRYPEMLEAKLNARHDGRRYRVWNLGVAGSNSSMALKRLEDAIPKYRPQLVVALTGNNDFWNLSESEYWKFNDGEMGASDELLARARIFLHEQRTFKLALLVKQMITGGRRLNEYNERAETTTSTEEKPDARASIDLKTHERMLTYNLTKLVEFAAENDVQLVFMNYFTFHAFRVGEVLAETAALHGVPFVDNCARYHQIPVADREGFLIPDRHPNARGYALIVDNLVDVLEQNRIIPPAGANVAP
jgi:lysophospholipase L1-like esterase